MPGIIAAMRASSSSFMPSIIAIACFIISGFCRMEAAAAAI
jgi:hypothetical protein